MVSMTCFSSPLRSSSAWLPIVASKDMPRPPNVPTNTDHKALNRGTLAQCTSLLRALWSVLVGIWGILKGSWSLPGWFHNHPGRLQKGYRGLIGELFRGGIRGPIWAIWGLLVAYRGIRGRNMSQSRYWASGWTYILHEEPQHRAQPYTTVGWDMR